MKVKYRVGKVVIDKKMITYDPKLPPVAEKFVSVVPYYKKGSEKDVLFNTPEEVEAYVTKNLVPLKEKCEYTNIKCYVDTMEESDDEKFSDDFGDWGAFDQSDDF